MKKAKPGSEMILFLFRLSKMGVVPWMARLGWAKPIMPS